MAYRTGAVLKVAATNTPQPMFGSWVTAGAGFTAPSDSPLTLTLGTEANAGNDATQLFVAGEAVWLLDPNGTHGETAYLSSISGNTVTLGPKTSSGLSGRNPVTEYPHVVGGIGVGTFIFPKQMFNNYLINLEDGGTGAFLYLGNAYNMTTAFRRFYKLAKTTAGVQPQFYDAGMFSAGNSFDLSELWVYGTANDTYNVSLNVN